jgi:hypothetical protein
MSTNNDIAIDILVYRVDMYNYLKTVPSGSTSILPGRLVRFRRRRALLPLSHLIHVTLGPAKICFNFNFELRDLHL